MSKGAQWAGRDNGLLDPHGQGPIGEPDKLGRRKELPFQEDEMQILGATQPDPIPLRRAISERSVAVVPRSLTRRLRGHGDEIVAIHPDDHIGDRPAGTRRHRAPRAGCNATVATRSPDITSFAGWRRAATV